MAKPVPQRQITLDELEAATTAGNLPGTAQQLVQERNWLSLGILFAFAGGPRVPVPDLLQTARAVSVALERMTEVKRGDALAVDGARGVRLAAAEAVLRRAEKSSGEDDRAALGTAAGLLLESGETRRAAATFERAGDDARAAEAWGALGELERMEACLQREETRRTAILAAHDALRRFEALLAAGEREAAVRAAAALADSTPDAVAARQLARALDARLCRGRAVSLRLADGRVVRLAALPAVLGRDPAAAIPIRDPSASRRHAALTAARDDTGIGIALEDLGSRTGTRLGGLAIGARLPLVGEGTVGLGSQCELAFEILAPGRLLLRGAAGLDWGLLAVVGTDVIPLSDVVADALAGHVFVTLAGNVARLGRKGGVTVRVEGRLMGELCDLLHGDVVEIDDGSSPTLRLEVE